MGQAVWGSDTVAGFRGVGTLHPTWNVPGLACSPATLGCNTSYVVGLEVAGKLHTADSEPRLVTQPDAQDRTWLGPPVATSWVPFAVIKVRFTVIKGTPKPIPP